MGTRESFVRTVAEQAGLGDRLTWQKMFGEYAPYVDGTVVAFACDDHLLVKPTDATAALTAAFPTRPPYPGGRELPVANDLLDDPEGLRTLLLATHAALPPPRPKRPTSKRPTSRKPPPDSSSGA